MPTIARADRVTREQLLAFLRPRHRALLVTTRADGSPQTSPVTCGVDEYGRVVVATYPARAKVVNLRANPAASITVLSDDWNGPWVQVDGTVEVIDLPAALDPGHLAPEHGALQERVAERGEAPLHRRSRTDPRPTPRTAPPPGPTAPHSR